MEMLDNLAKVCHSILCSISNNYQLPEDSHEIDEGGFWGLFLWVCRGAVSISE